MRAVIEVEGLRKAYGSYVEVGRSSQHGFPSPTSSS